MDPDGRDPLINDAMFKIVSSETFIRFGEAIGASRLNAVITGYDFRGNEFSGFGRVEQLAIALISAPVAAENTVLNVERKSVIGQINPRNLIPTQTKSDLTGSQVSRLTKDMKKMGMIKLTL